jgi:hypothetical protein
MGDNKIKALHYFIKEATVGELNYILEDMGNILGNKDFLNEPEILQAIREYHEEHLSQQTLPDGTKVLVSKNGRREADAAPAQEGEGEGDSAQPEASPSVFTYVDEARNTKFTLDVSTGE